MPFSGEDLIINPKDFPGINKGDIVEIYHPEDEFSRLLLQITSFKEDLQTRETISVEQSIATAFQLRTYADVYMNIVKPADVALDSVELTFKDQYMGRSEMWRLKNSLVVFRSNTSMVYLFIQMSSEMWDFDIHGDLYFEKAVNGFLADLFQKWKDEMVRACEEDGDWKSGEEVNGGGSWEKTEKKMDGRCKGRYPEEGVAVQNERYDDWTNTLVQLRRLFTDYQNIVLEYHKRPGVPIPNSVNSTAAQGNFLEVLNMSLNAGKFTALTPLHSPPPVVVQRGRLVTQPPPPPANTTHLPLTYIRLQSSLAFVCLTISFYPFSFEAVDKLDNSLQTEFLDLKYDCEAKIIFKQSGYELGWVKIMDTYPQLWGKTEPLLISFPSTYLVEKGFMFEKHYLDRSFDRTGQLSVVITPGVGVFEVDRELTNVTKQRIIDNGVGSDLVCVGEQPLHAVPLLKFHNKDTSLNAADDYSMPHWINLSFYSTNKKVAYSNFIPRIKLPPKRAKPGPAADIRFIPSAKSKLIQEDECMPNSLFDYDAYDAQVFQLPPVHMARITGIKPYMRNKERCREVANTKPCGTGIPVWLMDSEVYWGNPCNSKGSSFQPNNGKDEGKETGCMGNPVTADPFSWKQDEFSQSLQRVNSRYKKMSVTVPETDQKLLKRKMSDPDIHHGLLAGTCSPPGKSTTRSAAISIPQHRPTELSPQNSSVNPEVKSKAFVAHSNLLEGETTSPPFRPVVGSAGSPSNSGHTQVNLILPGRALINPFDPSHVTIKLTSNRRRWTHIFPKEDDFTIINNGDIWPSGCLIAPYYGKLLPEQIVCEESPCVSAPVNAAVASDLGSQEDSTRTPLVGPGELLLLGATLLAIVSLNINEEFVQSPDVDTSINIPPSKVYLTPATKLCSISSPRRQKVFTTQVFKSNTRTLTSSYCGTLTQTLLILLNHSLPIRFSRWPRIVHSAVGCTVAPRGGSPSGVLIQQHHYQAVPAVSSEEQMYDTLGGVGSTFSTSPGNENHAPNIVGSLPRSASQITFQQESMKGRSFSRPNLFSDKERERIKDKDKVVKTNKSLTLLWGATGEQEWTPALTTGVDWKSLTIPACLPITTDYFPDKRSLQNDFVVSDYNLLPDDVNADFAQRRAIYKKPLTTKEVFRELVSQRLAQGFQLIFVPKPGSNKQAQTPGSAGNIPVSGISSLVMSRPRDIEPTEEYLLSIGRVFHKISLSGSEITVTRYRPRHPYPPFNIHYRYRFHAPHHGTYEMSWVSFTTEKLENFNWNYLDHYICTRGDTDFQLAEAQKYWRFRMYLLPLNHVATKKILEGADHCDIYTPLSSEELGHLVEGFLRFLETYINRNKRPGTTKILRVWPGAWGTRGCL
uniref:DEP domain-containing protein n=1 Tax=Timema monikensis TaxID=170555 RepID=A0A7R9E6G5_9NEOP|nr:unnamed protein product [Timema monikensis]